MILILALIMAAAVAVAGSIREPSESDLTLAEMRAAARAAGVARVALLVVVVGGGLLLLLAAEVAHLIAATLAIAAAWLEARAHMAPAPAEVGQ